MKVAQHINGSTTHKSEELVVDESLSCCTFKLNMFVKKSSSPSHFKRMCFFSNQRPWLMKHVWDKLCGFIHYNVQNEMCVVTYTILKLEIKIKYGTYHTKWGAFQIGFHWKWYPSILMVRTSLELDQFSPC